VPIVINITESQVLTVLRSYLLSILSSVSVVRGQNNRVSMPTGDFVVMTPMLRARLATNVDSYTTASFPAPTTTQAMQATEITVQLDIFGPSAGNNAQILTTLFRDDNACAFFAASGYPIAPLYADDARQMQFIDGENQYENRYSVDVYLQANIALTVPQQFANVVKVGIINVDAAFPPR